LPNNFISAICNQNITLQPLSLLDFPIHVGYSEYMLSIDLCLLGAKAKLTWLILLGGLFFWTREVDHLVLVVPRRYKKLKTTWLMDFEYFMHLNTTYRALFLKRILIFLPYVPLSMLCKNLVVTAFLSCKTSALVTLMKGQI
jgi:hypothetical protein